MKQLETARKIIEFQSFLTEEELPNVTNLGPQIAEVINSTIQLSLDGKTSHPLYFSDGTPDILLELFRGSILEELHERISSIQFDDFVALLAFDFSQFFPYIEPFLADELLDTYIKPTT